MVLVCSLAAADGRPAYSPGSISDPNYIRIFDTTLRDGEQSPGATMTSKEKLDIAKQLSRLGVDVIEAGFPVASPDDFEAVRTIAKEVGNDVHPDGFVPVICGLSRTKLADLDRAWDAVRHAKRPRVHTFLATSEIHMKYKLRMSKVCVGILGRPGRGMCVVVGACPASIMSACWHGWVRTGTGTMPWTLVPLPEHPLCMTALHHTMHARRLRPSPQDEGGLSFPPATATACRTRWLRTR